MGSQPSMDGEAPRGQESAGGRMDPDGMKDRRRENCREKELGRKASKGGGCIVDTEDHEKT